MARIPTYDLVIQNGILLYGSKNFHVHLCIKDGKIASILDSKMMVPDTKEIYDAAHKYLFPGLIDPHVHFALNLGEHTSADDFKTGSKAAAFGGYTTVFDFTDVISNSIEELEDAVDRRKEQASDSYINTQLHLTLAEPKFSPAQAVELAIRHKLKSIKVFTTYSDSNRMTSDGYLYDLLKATRGTKIMVMVHCENDGIIQYKSREFRKKGNVPCTAASTIHNTLTEKEAVLRVCQFAIDADSKVYIAHVSSGETVKRVNECFGEYLGKNIFLETCPHYIYLNNTYTMGENAHLYTVCPALRDEDERLLLRKQLLAGLLHTIGSDHCPFPKEVKEQYKDDYLNIPNGLPGVELSFSLMYNLLMLEHSKMTIESLAGMFSTTPAKIFGYYPQKGTLFPGSDADIMIYDPNHSWKVDASLLHMNTDYTPYDGLMLRGRVDSTICGGKFIVKNKEFFPDLKNWED